MLRGSLVVIVGGAVLMTKMRSSRWQRVASNLCSHSLNSILVIFDCLLSAQDQCSSVDMLLSRSTWKYSHPYWYISNLVSDHEFLSY